jgi:hypothetical protein
LNRIQKHRCFVYSTVLAMGGLAQTIDIAPHPASAAVSQLWRGGPSVGPALAKNLVRVAAIELADGER